MVKNTRELLICVIIVTLALSALLALVLIPKQQHIAVSDWKAYTKQCIRTTDKTMSYLGKCPGTYFVGNYHVTIDNTGFVTKIQAN